MGTCMKPRDVFEIVVRTIGLLIVIYDGFLFSALFFEVVGLPVRHAQTTGVDALYGVVFLAMGLFCLFGGRAIAGFFYKEEKTSN